MYRGWTQIDYQNKHYNINQRDEGTLDDRGRDGGTSYILRIKEQETRLNLHEHDDDDHAKTSFPERILFEFYATILTAGSAIHACLQSDQSYSCAVYTRKHNYKPKLKVPIAH